jgi:hypothetical protein
VSLEGTVLDAIGSLSSIEKLVHRPIRRPGATRRMRAGGLLMTALVWFLPNRYPLVCVLQPSLMTLSPVLSG